MPKSTLDSIKKSINDNIDTIKVKANVSAMYNYESVLEKLEIKAAKVTAVDDFFNNIQQ
jgi:hypothetical protein